MQGAIKFGIPVINAETRVTEDEGSQSSWKQGMREITKNMI